MSKYQLEQPGGSGPSTMYITSSGTVSQRQVELMQKDIDRQHGKEVVLCNDNDAAGVRFNPHHMNDFRAPRQNVGPGNR
ncbi:toprim domain-containing protein [Hymenobacter sp. J193]|uniref:toprim domain-containing protein n=1 Tax=Hymenobacter sp. J193 TaxID=2898429 RepID=UPI0021512273|nr:toprim domain-containing protein [Hymenobacter sp. J193]MCR5890480.1 toprim domain-containing protein [Hymenobacter sp. J193]